MTITSTINETYWHLIEPKTHGVDGWDVTISNDEPHMLRYLLEPWLDTHRIAAIRRTCSRGNYSHARVTLEPLGGNDPVELSVSLHPCDRGHDPFYGGGVRPSEPEAVPAPQRGLRIDIDGTVTEVEWTADTALATMQQAVGGLIQMIGLPTYGLLLVCHDEAKLQEGWMARINPYATDLYGRECACDIPSWDAIVGPVLVISNAVTADGDAVGLSSYGLSDVRCWLMTGWLAREGIGVR